MNLQELNRIYFIGVGGIGMSALARHFKKRGMVVSGYDKTETDLTRALAAEGINVTYEDSRDTLDKEAGLVIYTPAIPSDHIQLNYYRDNGYEVVKRAQVLGKITGTMRGLAVAGSHGKTSTSALLNHILQTAGFDTAAFLGGISLNYSSNYVDGHEWSVAEADEFDRSFHQLHPVGAIITSVDTDHLDVYGNIENIREAFRTFAGQVSNTLIYNESVPDEVPNRQIRHYSYGFSEDSDFYPVRLEVSEGRYTYDVATPTGVVNGLTMTGGGRHNVENSIGALALAMCLGVEAEDIRKAIATYRGVQRRFEIHINRPDVVYIDDYAHHPREIEVTLKTARELFPGRKMTAVFQPHLYSRTRDLAEGLAGSLSLADEIILLDIYPAREKPIEGIDSGVIYKLLTKTAHLVPKNQVIKLLNQVQPELLLTIGAGDIDTLVEPIRDKFREN